MSLGGQRFAFRRNCFNGAKRKTTDQGRTLTVWGSTSVAIKTLGFENEEIGTRLQDCLNRIREEWLNRSSFLGVVSEFSTPAVQGTDLGRRQ